MCPLFSQLMHAPRLIHCATHTASYFRNTTSTQFFFWLNSDSFLRSRSSSDHEATAMMKAQFMSLWDGLDTDFNCQVSSTLLFLLIHSCNAHKNVLFIASMHSCGHLLSSSAANKKMSAWEWKQKKDGLFIYSFPSGDQYTLHSISSFLLFSTRTTLWS